MTEPHKAEQFSAEELEALTGGPLRTLDVGPTEDGLPLRITPLCTRELPAILSAAQPLLGLLTESSPEQAIQVALLSQPDALISVVAIAARVERAWLDERPLDQLIEITGAVLEVNLDFFTQRLAPLLSLIEQRISKRLAAGSASPPN